jgi:hypothetical protein
MSSTRERRHNLLTDFATPDVRARNTEAPLQLERILKMTTPKALPPGSNHHAEIKKVTAKFDNIREAAMERQTAPRPAGGRATVTAAIPVKSHRTYTAKT